MLFNRKGSLQAVTYNHFINKIIYMRLKNMLCVVLSVVLLFTSTSCIDIVEEMFLNKDGSGKYMMRMDMSGMISMIKMMSSMEDFGEESGEESEEGEASEENVFDNLLTSKEAVDSTMYLKDAAPELLAQFKDNPGFAKKVNIRMNADSDEGVFHIDFNLDFDNMDDIDYFFKNFDKIAAMMGDDEEGGEMDMLGGMGGGADSPLSGIMGDGLTRYFDLQKRTLIRRDATQQEMDSELEDLSAEDKQMMEMMFGDASYKAIYHFPGKVKKMTHREAMLSADKKTVTLEGGMMDYINGDFKVANIIKFGRK